jgi:hypothetical protein
MAFNIDVKIEMVATVQILSKRVRVGEEETIEMFSRTFPQEFVFQNEKK